MNKGLLNSEVLVKMVLEEDIESKEEYSELLLNYLTNSILTNMTEEFENSITSLKYKMAAMSEALDIYHDKTAMNSYFFGVIKTIIGVSEKINNEKYSMKDIHKIEKSEHGMNILHSLYDVKTINHGTLAKKLNISSHSLTNFMKRMEGTDLWSKSKYGKYINYDITPIGEKCYQYMIMSNQNQIEVDNHKHYLCNINKLIEVIIDEISSETPNVNKIAHEVVKENDKLSEWDERFLRLNISRSIRRRNNKFSNIIDCSSNDIGFKMIYIESDDFDESDVKKDLNVIISRSYGREDEYKNNHLFELIGR